MTLPTKMSALKNPQISSSHWVKFAGFCVFGDCEICKAGQTCICTGDENEGYPKGSIPLALGFQ